MKTALLVFSGEHRLQKGYTGWVKNRDSFPTKLLQNICYLGKLQFLLGFCFGAVGECYQSELLYFRAGFLAAEESRALSFPQRVLEEEEP